jgi:hypothetical protein
MSTKANQKIVEFLTAPENLRSVLEVMRHSDAVRGVLLSRFWKNLHEQLQSQLPAELADAQPEWEGVFKPERMLDKYVFIDLHLNSSRFKKQALFYRIEHEAGQRHHDLYFGLHWREPVKSGSSVLAQRDVNAVETRQRELDFEFDNNPSWLGWKYIKKCGSLDDFVAEFTEEPQSLLDDISKPFLEHVQQTYLLVIEANKSIV